MFSVLSEYYDGMFQNITRYITWKLYISSLYMVIFNPDNVTNFAYSITLDFVFNASIRNKTEVVGIVTTDTSLPAETSVPFVHIPQGSRCIYFPLYIQVSSVIALANVPSNVFS